MDQSKVFIGHYEHNNVIYEVSGTEEFHTNMGTDCNFASTYLDELATNNVEKDATLAEQQVVIQGFVEKGIDDDIPWDNPAIKLLLNEYLLRKERFRNPKVKKKLLWGEIAAEFKNKNYQHTADAISKKFANMKTTYSKIKKNNSKRTTGAGRKPWYWLIDMDEIFHSDLSINFGSDVVTSMRVEESNEVLNLSTSSSSSSNNVLHTLDEGNTTVTTPNTSSFSEDSNEKAPHTCYKSARGKNIYYHRKKQLDVDCNKLEVMRALNEKLEDSKNLQKENCKLWNERMTEMTQVLKERNEILKEIAKILRDKN